jgi:hypothetical protein
MQSHGLKPLVSTIAKTALILTMGAVFAIVEIAQKINNRI